MKKIAIFVEGQTEQELVIWIVTQIAGTRGLHVAKGKQHANKVQLTATSPLPNTAYYVLIVDCSSDVQVKTQINEQYETLVKSGFTEIIGLRDIYPLSVTDLPSIIKSLGAGLPDDPIVPQIHLAVLEVESWFISEITHFERLHAQLTLARIEAAGFAVSTTASEAWEHPANTLHAIYKLEKLAYKKKLAHARRTIASLSYGEFSTSVRNAIPELAGFLTNIEHVLV